MDPESYYLFVCLFVDEGREDPKKHYKRAIISPSVKPHKLAYRWCADDGSTLRAGVVAL